MLSALFAFLVTEAAVRLVVDDGMQFDLEMWKYARDVKIVSDDPLIGHEHGANREAQLMGVKVATNSHGLRDREFAFERTPGVRRILLIGDSLTLGWGVEAEDTFAKRLERLFAADGKQVEVVNTGVGNWNTVQEVQYFLAKGAAYKPDIVVLGFFVNDAEPSPRASEPSFFMRHCHACVFILGRLDSVSRRFFGGKPWDEYYLDLFGNGDTPGWLAAKGAMRQLADYCKANGIALIIANLPELHDVKEYRFERSPLLSRMRRGRTVRHSSISCPCCGRKSHRDCGSHRPTRIPMPVPMNSSRKASTRHSRSSHSRAPRPNPPAALFDRSIRSSPLRPHRGKKPPHPCRGRMPRPTR